MVYNLKIFQIWTVQTLTQTWKLTSNSLIFEFIYHSGSRFVIESIMDTASLKLIYRAIDIYNFLRPYMTVMTQRTAAAPLEYSECPVTLCFCNLTPDTPLPSPVVVLWWGAEGALSGGDGNALFSIVTKWLLISDIYHHILSFGMVEAY